MKNPTKYKLLVLLAVPMLYYVVFSGFNTSVVSGVEPKKISTSLLTPAPNNGKDFVNCILNGNYSGNTPDWVENNFDKYTDSLHFNTIHIYDVINGYDGNTHQYINGTERYGLFLYPLEDSMITNTNTLLTETHNNDLRLLYERCKISKLCYAQRLVYEVSQNNNSENNGFCYTSCANYTTDSGRTVAHGTDPVQQYPNGYWLAANIYENLQHSDLYDFNVQYADSGTWYMKPMMRIDSSIVDSYPEKPVVRIVVTDYRGNDTIKNVVIKAKHFGTFDIGLGQYLYNGRYVDIFNFEGEPTGYNLEVSGTKVNPNGLGYGRSDYYWEWPAGCHIDFKVYWMGQVEAWFDKMTVDDKWANRMFNGEFDDGIEAEVTNFSDHQGLYSFYADEITYSQIPACKYVDSVMKQYNANARLHFALTNYHHTIGLKNTSMGHRGIFETVHPYSVNPDAHELSGLLPPALKDVDPRFNRDIWQSTGNDDYNRQLQERVFGDRNAQTNKQTYWAANDKRYLPTPQGSLVYQIELARQQINQYSPDTKMLMQPQIHAWILYSAHSGTFWGGNREPTNEEIQAEAMLSIAHGAEGICWFIYNSAAWPTGTNVDMIRPYYIEQDTIIPDPCDTFFMFGLMQRGPDNKYSVPRHRNLYGQDKWNYVAEMNKKIETWKPTLDAVNWQDGYSVHSQYSSGAFGHYIESIASIDPLKPGQNDNCVEQGLEGYWTDCNYHRYWEIGYFNDLSNSSTKYFLMANRRCYPDSGARVLRIKFDSDNMPSQLKNWKLTEVGKPDHSPVFFSSTNGGFIDLGNQYEQMGWFKPGEGKLFKLEPTSKGGGTLVADEIIPGTEEFTCEDTVWTDGHNLTIQNGAKIHFSDSTKFVVEEGTFIMGNPNQSGQDITMDAAPNSSWKGFEFHGANVGIYNTAFSGLANDSISMLTFIDCPLISLKSNAFSTGTGNNKSCVDINYTDPWQAMSNAYIGSNTFTTGDAEIPALKVMAYSGFTTPVIIESNNFSGNNTAIFLDNIQGGAVKSNALSGYWSGLTALSSSLDVYNNTITSSANNTYGIQGLSGTELRMSYAGGLLLGGRNTLTNSGTTTNNVYLDNSYFLMDEGENIFDIGSNSHHLYGWFPDSYQGSYNETENCFKVNSSSVDPPNHYVTLGEQGSQISFTFTPYLTGCQQGDGGDMMAINLGNGIYDTVAVMGGGGSMKGEYIVTPKSIYDSVCVMMRYRNYNNTKNLCQYLLNTFPDSSQSIGAVSKLFLAVSKTDTSSQSVTALKTFYENLILNHPNNITLVKRCNYYVQKCKVLLHQYSSALSGFQQIINQNPSNYEGLVARWDYMATSLLMQGQGGAERETIPFWDEEDDDPTSPLSKEEKKQIKQTVTSVLEVSKTSEKKKIDVLTQLSEKGDELAAVKLKVIKALEQTVKVERPKDIVEHMRIVTNDIKKVFVNPNAGKNKNNSLIPTVFNLSQNYPNPFNPKTKINYDIPKNSFVKLIVYDILGREVIRLVNNEYKQPGRYVVEFNGTNLASGVYFYRIEARQAGSSTGDYVESKKMVLVK